VRLGQQHQPQAVELSETDRKAKSSKSQQTLAKIHSSFLAVWHGISPPKMIWKLQETAPLEVAPLGLWEPILLHRRMPGFST